MRVPRRSRKEGFSLLEVAISLGIFATLMISMFTIAGETSAYVRDTESAFTVQREATGAFQKLKDVLQRSSWVTIDGITYPRIPETMNGTSGEPINLLEFRVLDDLDGNGYPFEEATGLLEWNTNVFSIRHDPAAGTLAAYRGDLPVRHLGYHVKEVQLDTFLEDNSLDYKEIHASILAEMTSHRGKVISFKFSGSFYMRN